MDELVTLLREMNEWVEAQLGRSVKLEYRHGCWYVVFNAPMMIPRRVASAQGENVDQALCDCLRVGLRKTKEGK